MKSNSGAVSEELKHLDWLTGYSEEILKMLGPLVGWGVKTACPGAQCIMSFQKHYLETFLHLCCGSTHRLQQQQNTADQDQILHTAHTVLNLQTMPILLMALTKLYEYIKEAQTEM